MSFQQTPGSHEETREFSTRSADVSVDGDAPELAGYICYYTRAPTPPPQIEWNVLAPRLRQKHHLFPNIHDPRMYYYGRWGAFRKLLAKTITAEGDSEFFFDLARQPTQGGLEGLPTEILDLIFAMFQVEEFEEFGFALIALGLCSRAMWNRVLGYVLRNERVYDGCWAGTPIICAAETMEDFPEEIVLKENIDARNWFEQASNEFHEVARYRHWSEYLELFAEIDSAVEELPGQGWYCPMALRLKVEAVLRELREPRGCKAWALRNWNEKKFVRLQLGPNKVIQEQESGMYFVHIEGEPNLELDLMLLGRICWSGSHEDGAGPKGEWAGHCFDIVEIGQWVPEKEWVDVTTDFVAEGYRVSR